MMMRRCFQKCARHLGRLVNHGAVDREPILLKKKCFAKLSSDHRPVGQAVHRTNGTLLNDSLSCGTLLVVCCLVITGCARGSQIVLATAQGPQKQLQAAATFYGIDVRVVHIQNADGTRAVLSAADDPQTLGLVISADVLARVNSRRILQNLNKRRRNPIPVLISRVTSKTSSKALSDWSGGAIGNCEPIPTSNGSISYLAGRVKGITDELSGQRIPSTISAACGFVETRPDHVDDLVMLDSATERAPIFLRTMNSGQEVFLEARMEGYQPQTIPSDMGFFARYFAELMNEMLFLRYVAGEQAWHSPAHYANFTVDDVWLREPYGHFSFLSALKEMQKHHFHTTIAFIPWNFDRSEAATVRLVKDHPDRFSICVHGDNHDRMEFLTGDEDNPIPIPSEQQAKLLVQALARMQRFTRATGIPHDAVMVFPHEKYPLQLLHLMKTYDYLAATNATILPVGEQQPVDPLFYLEPATFAFGNFPVIRRYPIELADQEYQVAIHAFLENPLLFYGHQSDFAGGFSAVDRLADLINTLQPDVVWTDLGNIARHLYRVRRRSDGDYDVQSTVADFWIDNSLDRVTTYYISRVEDHSDTIKNVLVDGKPFGYIRSNGKVELRLSISARSNRHIVFLNAKDIDLASVDVSKHNLRINLLRHSSDFRDIRLSQFWLGDKLTGFYYDRSGRSRRNYAHFVMAGLLFLTAFLALVISLRLYRRLSSDKLP